MRIAQARARERARIAREMHDVLAHRISLDLDARQCAWRSGPTWTPTRSRDQRDDRQDTAHEALADLRGVLGVLRDSRASSRRPSRRTAIWRAGGGRALGGIEGELRRPAGHRGPRVPDVIGRTVYRIVQEGMTNAAKHAPGAPVLDRVSGTPADGVTVSVRNRIGVRRFDDLVGAPGSGLGLVGLRGAGRAARRPPRGRRERPLVCCEGGSRGRADPGSDPGPGRRRRPAGARGLGLMLGGAEPTSRSSARRPTGKKPASPRPATASDVVLMDIRMPVLDGWPRPDRAARRRGPPHVIVLTTFDADDTCCARWRRGADGFLLKDTPPAEILDAIRRVAAGEPMLSAVGHPQADRPGRATRSATTADAWRRSGSLLTDREREVALAVGPGADQRGDRGRAVPLRAHGEGPRRPRCSTKLGFTNRVQIAIVVHDAGLTRATCATCLTERRRARSDVDAAPQVASSRGPS